VAVTALKLGLLPGCALRGGVRASTHDWSTGRCALINRSCSEGSTDTGRVKRRRIADGNASRALLAATCAAVNGFIGTGKGQEPSRV